MLLIVDPEQPEGMTMAAARDYNFQTDVAPGRFGAIFAQFHCCSYVPFC
jgi:hypothetical protein